MAVSCPHTFSLGCHNCLVLPLVTRGLLPNALKSLDKIDLHSTQWYGFLKIGKRWGGTIQILQREKLVQSHKKLSVILGNLILHHPFLSLPKKTSFFQIVQVENIRGHLFEKRFLISFSPLSPQVEQKEDDEHFFNHLQMM